MSLINVPIHLSRIQLDHFTIIKSGGTLPNTYSHKLLLGVIHAHIVTNLNTKYIYDFKMS